VPHKEGHMVNRHKLRLKVLSVVILTSLLGAQTNLAIIPLDTKGVSDIEASVLTDRLGLELYKTGLFTILERDKVEKILSEQYFQLPICKSKEHLLEAGRRLGVEQLMVGNVNKIGNTCSVTLKLIDARSGAIVQVVNYDHPGTLAQLWDPGMRVVAHTIAAQFVAPAKYIIAVTDPKEAAIPFSDAEQAVLFGEAEQLVKQARQPVPVADQYVAPVARRGNIYFLSRVGLGYSGWGDTLSWGGQIGYGNASGGKIWIDFLNIYDYSFNMTILYELRLWRLFTQFGWGFVSDQKIKAFGYRLRFGFDITSGKFILIRPSVDLNLGFLQGQSSYAFGLDFGLKLFNP